MLKMALLDCAINEKCCSVVEGRDICPLFSSPPRGIWQLKSPYPRENANARVSARGGGAYWAQLELTDAKTVNKPASSHTRGLVRRYPSLPSLVQTFASLKILRPKHMFRKYQKVL